MFRIKSHVKSVRDIESINGADRVVFLEFKLYSRPVFLMGTNIPNLHQCQNRI